MNTKTLTSVNSMYEWTKEDEEASREGAAIKNSLHNKPPRRPRGVSLQDLQKDKELEDVITEHERQE